MSNVSALERKQLHLIGVIEFLEHFAQELHEKSKQKYLVNSVKPV